MMRRRVRGEAGDSARENTADPTRSPATPPCTEAASAACSQRHRRLVTALAGLHVVVAAGAALRTPPPDCDEVFNYWEPLHYLLYGSGLQTWEYSPVYGLRSYLYIVLHAALASPWIALASSKLAVFYAVRCSLVVCSGFAHRRLLLSFADAVDGSSAVFAAYFLAVCPGMLTASASFLPQSFCMSCMSLAFAAWIQRRPFACVFWAAAAGLVGWPFVLPLVLPIAWDLLLSFSLLHLLRSAVLAALACLVPSFLVDLYYYRTPTLPILSIVAYNAITSGDGANLYGVEPWHFYARNLLLNLNVVVPLALAAVPVSLLQTRSKRLGRWAWKYLCPALWFVAVFSCMAHKEERFLYPVYPLLGLLGGVGLRLLPLRPLRLGLLLAFTALSASRIAATLSGYHAPLAVFTHLSRVAGDKPVNVCLGKEWYRYPSSFFLSSSDSRLLFLRSGFAGLLPRPFAREGGTWKIPTNMNDRNLAEPDAFVDEFQCDFIVDLDLEHQQEPHYLGENPAEWTLVREEDFLDAAASPSLLRAFYVPGVSPARCKYRPYQLLQRRRSEPA